MITLMICSPFVLQTLTRVFGALFASQIFSAFIAEDMYMPGAPFLMSSFVEVIAVIVVELLFHPMFPKEPLQPVGDDHERQRLVGPGIPTPHEINVDDE
jgi:hypothetical protein